MTDKFRPLLAHPSDPRPRPMAGCPECREPLISTFERPKKEFHCLVCGRWWAFLSPVPIDPEENKARYEELLARFEAGERGPIKFEESEVNHGIDGTSEEGGQ